MAGHQREDSSLKSTLVCVGASLSLPCACQVGGNAPVKLPGAVTKAAATQARRLRSPSLQLRRVEWRRSTANKNYNDGKNVNASNKSASMNATAKATKPNADMNAKSTAPFALNDVTAGSVHRAHLIRNTDFERLQKLYNFFVANVNAKGEHVDQHHEENAVAASAPPSWHQRTGEDASAEFMAAATQAAKVRARQIRKTDFERFQKFYNYNLFVSNDDITNAKVNTKHDQVDQLPEKLTRRAFRHDQQHVLQMVRIIFVLRVVLLRLTPEKRAACQLLREILTHNGHARLVLMPTTKGLQPAFGAATTDEDGCLPDNTCTMRSARSSSKPTTRRCGMPARTAPRCTQIVSILARNRPRRA
ncbi:hypothetical protein PF008_g28012 [Phytophthora fragariae]|uniref:Uncharacterized protein n=2 Tax=Phytophthora fragariae TaxID=53985 RepID=A0A6G0QCP0_9STRA|nr:hypothetical protein PF008_g28012 [Phytophthora fragariae]